VPDSSTPIVRANITRRPIDIAWASAAFLIPLILTLQTRLGTIDLTYHLRAGESILTLRSIPSFDTYTFTIRGLPWLDQQWGAQVLLAFVYRLGGFDLLYLFRALLPAVGFSFVYLACRARGAPPRTSATLSLLGTLVAVPTIALRPQLVALPFFAMTLWALASRGEHPRRIWLLPPAAFLVANLHGSFVLFPLIAGLALVEDSVRRRGVARDLVPVTVMTFLATLATPFGPRAWVYAYDLSTNPVIRDTISEWEPVTLPNVIGVFTIGSMLAIGAVLARRGDRATWADLLWLVIFASMALVAIRGIVWWTLVAPVTVAALFAAPTTTRHKKENPVPAVAIVGILAIAAFIFLPWIRPGGVLLDAPPGISKAVGRLPAGSRLFVHQPWASWLEFAYPDHLFYSDSRIEIFPREIWEDYSEVAFAGAGWQRVLARWQPDAIAAEDEWELIPYLRDDPAWRVAYEDDDGVLFVRA